MKFKVKSLLFLLFIFLVLQLFTLHNHSAIVKAQTQTTSTSSSIIWREYPYIQPHLVQNSTHYVYVTDWGNYSFSKAMPYVCRYTYRNGKEMVSFSTFWINTSSMLVPLNPTVLVANNTHFQISVEAYRLTTKMATLTQTWSFNRVDRPKISVSLVKTANWNLGDFNIFWVVAGYQYVKQNETSTNSCNRTMTYWKKDVKVEMGNTVDVSSWRDWLIVDWSDEGLADVRYGQFSIFGYSLTVVKVDFSVNDGKIDPYVVGTSTSSGATSLPFQRKSFYASGRYWVFYSDGTNMVYSTSTDGSTWTSATAIRACTSGAYFSIWFNGTYLHYAYAFSSSIYYRRGVPNSDGTISWSTTTEQVVSTAYNRVYYPMVSVDSNGYVWIGYYDIYIDENLNKYYYPYVIKSGNNNGTWGTTPTGFPHRLEEDSQSSWRVSVIPLTSGKMLVIYTLDYGSIRTKAWNGSAWGDIVYTTSQILESTYYSAVAQGDNVHLTFLKYPLLGILYVKYTYSTNSFGTETTLQAGATSTSAPVISIDPSTNNLYVFWAGYPTANHIYYRKYTASTNTWETAVDWITESVLTGNDRLTCFYQAGGNKIGLMYMTGSTSPYYVVFAYLPLNTPPTIGQFQAPSIVYANKYFYLNMTINDANGITDFVNATIEINGTIVLKWDNATNTFSKVSDPNGYCTLDATNSIRTNINTTAHKLSFKIKLGWNYPEGYISVSVTNTKCFDKAGAYGSNSYTNLFYFEGDLIVSSASVNDTRINPGQGIRFSGKLYYEGTTIPPEDVSGITAKVNLGTTLKGSTTIIGSDGSFSISFAGESTVGSYSYTVYATTVRNTVQNQTVNVIVDKDKMCSFAFSGSTLANMTFRLLSEYYSNTLNNTDLTLRVYFNNETLCSILAKSNGTGYVSVRFTKNIVKNGTLTFNLTDADGIVSYSYSCPVYVYVENIEVYSIDPMILYTGDSLTITMLYKSKANINGTYLALSNIYWKALIYTDKYYGYYNFPLYNGTFANVLESKTLSMPIALNEGSYMLNMTLYIRGSDEFLGNAVTPYFVVKSRPVTSGGAPATVVKLPLTVVVRDSKGKFVEGVNITITDMYNGTVWSGKTDVWGSAMITLNPGTYTITVRYDNQTLTDSVTISDQPVTKEFTLQAPPISITPVTVALDNYSILWLSFGLIGAIGAVILERKEKTYLAIPLGLFTIGAVLHSLLVMTHQMPPFFTIPQFDLSSLLKVPSFSLPSFSFTQFSLDMQTITLIAVGVIVPIVIAYYITHREGTHKRRVRVGKFGATERRRAWK